MESKYNPMIHHRRSIRLKGYDYSRPGAYFVTICLDDKDNWILGEVVDGYIRLSRYGEIVWKCWNQLPRHYSNVKLDEFIVMPNHVHGIIWLIEPDEGAGAGAERMAGCVGAGLHRGKFEDVKPARTARDAHDPHDARDVHDAGVGEMAARMMQAAHNGQYDMKDAGDANDAGNDGMPGRRMDDADKGKMIHPLSEVVRGFKTFSARRINDLRGTGGVRVWQRNYWEHIVRNEAALQRIREYIANNPAKWKKDGFHR